jgi:hypothetical protein
VGIESAGQLNEIINASNLNLKNMPSWPNSIDSILINPSLWGAL